MQCMNLLFSDCINASKTAQLLKDNDNLSKGAYTLGVISTTVV